MSRKFIPVKKWILVKPDKEAQESEFGIITPDNVEKEQKAIGTVIRIGSEVELPIKEGTKVVYGAFAGEKMKIEKENEEYLFLNEEFILAYEDLEEL